MAAELLERNDLLAVLAAPCSAAPPIVTARFESRTASRKETWVHSCVSPDRTKTSCVYDGPSPEANRTAAERNKLPVDRISEVSVLDPYFYRAA